MKKLPRLKAGFEFSHSADGCGVVVDVVSDLGNERLLRVIRTDNKWRFAGGHWTNCHCIASHMFDYEEDRLSEQEMLYMGSYVEAVGQVLDQVSELVRNGVIARKEHLRRVFEIADFTPAAEQQKRDVESRQTFVYLMSHSNGLTKIGFSKNPKAREKTLQAEDPRLNIIDFFVASKETELRLHQIFKDVRVRGEWFNLEPHQIDWILCLLKGG